MGKLEFRSGNFKIESMISWQETLKWENWET